MNVVLKATIRPMQNTLDGVAVFVEVVQAGGFARAGERLALSRSAVGKAIARLEARLDVRLFHRTTRVQSLTEAGQLYYERCVRALGELRAAQSLLESGRREIAGRLRVTMSVLFGRHCVAPILLGLAQQHPKLQLDLHFSDQPMDVLADGFDLAIRSGAPGQGDGLRMRRLAVQQKVLCAAPAYLATRGRPENIAALTGHDALHYNRGGFSPVWRLPDGKGQVAEVTLTSRLRSDNLAVIADAAVAGLGIAWLSSWLVRDQIRAGTLVTILDDLPGATIETHALWPATPSVPLRVRLAIDTLASQLPRAIEP